MKTTEQSPSFVDVVTEIRRGASVAELSEALRELVATVRATNAKGHLVYTVTVKPAGKGDTLALIVTDDIVVKKPKFARESSVFFPTAENALMRDDPRQPELIDVRRAPASVDAVRRP